MKLKDRFKFFRAVLVEGPLDTQIRMCRLNDAGEVPAVLTFEITPLQAARYVPDSILEDCILCRFDHVAEVSANWLTANAEIEAEELETEEEDFPS